MSLNTNQTSARFYIDKAIAFEKQGALQKAERAYLEGIANFPEDYVLFSRLGALLVDLDRNEEAILRFEQALGLNPDDPNVFFNAGLAHQAANDFEGAIKYFEMALKKGADKGVIYGSLAEVFEQTNRLEELQTLLKKALTETPEDIILLFNAAKAARRDGNFEKALKFLEQAELKDDFSEIEMSANFERGRIWDKLNQPEKAFQAFKRGNILSVRENLLPGMDKRIFLNHIRNFSELELTNFLGIHPLDSGFPEKIPFFIVGFPRSGTTLLHQVLEGHPELDILEEEPILTILRDNLIKGDGSLAKTFANKSPTDWKKIRNEILGVYERSRKKAPEARIIDKLPLNIMNVPLILKLFPKTKFIVVLRHPFDCTLSCFMQNFGLNNAMLNFTNLDDTTRVYGQIMTLWQRYERELKPDYLYVRYEDMVSDLEKQARRILKFLDLPWDPEVLKYRERALAKGRISTPSYHQVIQPIYRESENRWRRYEKFFKPYRNRLVPFCEAFGYDHGPGQKND